MPEVARLARGLAEVSPCDQVWLAPLIQPGQNLLGESGIHGQGPGPVEIS